MCAPTYAVMILVCLTLPAMLAEGSAIDWSVIYMRDVFDTPPVINGLALALTAFCQFITRYFADGFVDKYGPRRIVKYCLWLILAGSLMIIFRLTGYYPCRVFLSGRRLFCGFPSCHVRCSTTERQASLCQYCRPCPSLFLFVSGRTASIGAGGRRSWYSLCLRHLSAPDTSCLFHPEKGVLK